LFWALLANGLVATQIVEDGTLSSLIVRLGSFSHLFGLLTQLYPQPYFFLAIAIFAGTLYIALDTAFGYTSVFQSDDPAALNNIGLFVLTSIWPGAYVVPEHSTRDFYWHSMDRAAIIYFLLMVYIVLGVLREVKPIWFFVLSFALFVLSQLDFFLLNKVICKVRHRCLLPCLKPHG
jgi:hypothetical protein